MAFQFKTYENLTGGYNLSERPDLLEDSETPNLKNVFFKNKSVSLDTGTDTLSASGASGTYKLIYEFEKKDGSIDILLFTTTGLYKKDGATWTSIATGFSGTATEAIRAVTWSANDWVIWTNGNDVVQKYNGTTNAVLGGLAGSGSDPTVDKCKDLEVFNNRLFLFNTVESGVANPQLVRWSDVADAEEFDSTNLSADAGFQALYDKDDKILRGVVLGRDLIIYRDNSIVRGEWVGSSDVTINFIEAVSNEGLYLSENLIVNMSDWHFVVGKTNIFKYTGANFIEPIGDRVYDKVFDVNAAVDLSKPQFMLAEYVTSLREIWVAFPFSTSSTFILRYNVRDNSWTYKEIAYTIYSLDEIRLASDDAWTAAVGDWTATSLKWNSQAFDADYPILLFVKSSSAEQYDLVTSGSGEYVYDTKDITFENKYFRIDYFDVEASGTSISIQVSVDSGSNWSNIDTISPGVSVVRTRSYYQLIAKKMRLRFTGTGGGFYLNRFGFSYQMETEW